jgi:hypothetical protein
MSSKEFGARTFVWLRQINADNALRPSDLKIAVALTPMMRGYRNPPSSAGFAG